MPLKLWTYAAIGIAVVVGVVWFVSDQRSIGGSVERERQGKANATFREELQKGASEFDACDRSGGLWDFRARTCQLP